MSLLVEIGRVVLDVVLAVGPMLSTERTTRSQHRVQMGHSRTESIREDVRDMLNERLDSSQNLTLKSTLLFGFVTAILVDGFPPLSMRSEACVDLFIFLVPWAICLLFQSMSFAVLYQRGMMTMGHRHIRMLQHINCSEGRHEEGSDGSSEISWRQQQHQQLDPTIPGRALAGRVWGAAVLVGRATWGLTARLFGVSPQGLRSAGATGVPESADDEDEWCSFTSEPTPTLDGPEDQSAAVEASAAACPLLSPSEYVYIPLGPVTAASPEQPFSPMEGGEAKTAQEACDQTSTNDICSPINNNNDNNSDPRRRRIRRATELSHLPEVKALDLFEEQAYQTNMGGSLFTLLALAFLVWHRLQLRKEQYGERPMASVARIGIFMPPLLLAGFTSLISPYPNNYNRDLFKPQKVRPAVQCLALVAALISTVSLLFAVHLHSPLPRLQIERLEAYTVSRPAEWKVDSWPIFFIPTGIVAVQKDELLISADFRVARFRLQERDMVATLIAEQPLSGLEIGDATFIAGGEDQTNGDKKNNNQTNGTVVLAGRKELLRFSAGPGAALPWSQKQGASFDGAISGLAGVAEVAQGLAYWAARDLFFVSRPGLGVVAVRLAGGDDELGEAATLSTEFRVPLASVDRPEALAEFDAGTAVTGLHVDEEEQVLYMLLGRFAELHAVDLSSQSPGSLLRRFRLPDADPSDGPEADAGVVWGGVASLGRRLFVVSRSPAKLFSFELPRLRQCGAEARTRGHACRQS